MCQIALLEQRQHWFTDTVEKKLLDRRLCTRHIETMVITALNSNHTH